MHAGAFFGQDPEGEARACDFPGCEGTGSYPAPKARDKLAEYYYFCLEHVRVYNKAWNYCQGMSVTEIEAMIRQDTCWQRPTWPLGGWRAAERAVEDQVFREFFTDDPAAGRGRDQGARRNDAHGRALSAEEQALNTLDLDAPVDFATIKARYKTLVKQLHPDANGGSREAEEKLKTINLAYGTLKAAYAR
jgi:hypothetical protein